MSRVFFVFLATASMVAANALAADPEADPSDAVSDFLISYVGCARGYAKGYAPTSATPESVAEAALAKCELFIIKARQGYTKLMGSSMDAKRAFDDISADIEIKARREAIKAVLEARFPNAIK